MVHRPHLNILAFSGSLRVASLNTAFLRAMARLSPPNFEISIYRGLGYFPLFNPDISLTPPAIVANFQSRVAESDALIIASPEYAHGVTGTIKNTLDWLVGFEQFAGKPVAIINTSPRAHHANDSLRETLRTMAAQIVEPASITIPLLGQSSDECELANLPFVIESMSTLFGAIENHLHS
ncbi:MAG: NAD(P)H-dependent oxidoreductase [Candidatus Obscuribacterales bacterium]|nr:NAD(P)H-dependent oxidoreductase [Candidatus Obscuribacterales bacterium]